MSYPLVSSGDRHGPLGHSYAAVLVRTGARDEVLAALREVRFTGWLALPQDGWLPAVAAHAGGAVAAGRRGVIGVAQQLAERLGVTVIAVRVLADRQLLLAVWADGAELGRYLSDPSYGLDDDTLPDPLGVEHADGFAAACGRPEAAEELAELLSEELDPDSVIESERLAGVLNLLGLPRWLVGSASLPREIPTGPPTRELTRLGAGVPGFSGRLLGAVADVVRRRRPPPPVITDAPRGVEIDPWLF
jgi:hypothetical protein